MNRNHGRRDAHNRKLPQWEIGALIGALIIVLSPFAYHLRSQSRATESPPAAPVFVGSEKCGSCHQAAFDKWRGSHHDLAMDVADERTVLGDFNDVSFLDPYTGSTSRFFRQQGGFWVETEGPDGTPARFELTHTFGVYPLQQYLAPFPGGRLQCLNIAWDVEKKIWYRLPPYEVGGPGDWLHWTNGGQTWNGMCAECHSTALKKGFSLTDESYTTRWYEIDVGCEACHGPGSRHVAWAGRPEMARPPADRYELAVDTASPGNPRQIAVCAPCHSRRYQLGDNGHDDGEILDTMVPSLLDEALYYPDGQILEEVYVYGSFTQSKMYQHGVRCSDCHDIHSLKPHRPGNEICLQCHRADAFDNPAHHFHKREHEGRPSEGHLCVKCHMPGRYYMGIDYRPDHSLRIPRPDLSRDIGVPNSCSAAGCHEEKSLDWVIEHYDTWYGVTRKPHYGEVFAAARAGLPEAADGLIRVAEDSLLPGIVRATALSLLARYPEERGLPTFTRLLESPEALIRHTAIRHLNHLDPTAKIRLIAPKLYDRVKAVRIEAAATLASLPKDSLKNDDREPFKRALAEYRQAMLYNSDFAPQRFNLGNLEAALGNTDGAIAYFEQSLAIDNLFYPARVNLAMQLNRRGENERAAQNLRQVLKEQPDLSEVSYSLGLLLAEMEHYREAAVHLERAADAMPGYSRPRYNLALALMKLQKWEEAEQALLTALEVEPANRDYFAVLVDLYRNFGLTQRAAQLAETILAAVPGHREARELLQSLR